MLQSHVADVLVVTGALTFLAIVVTFAPVPALRIVFGSAAPDLVTTTLARHWGLLVALIGALLVYVGYNPEIRNAVMIAAATEKLVGVTVFGLSLPRRPALLAVIAADATMGILYLLILAGSLRTV